MKKEKGFTPKRKMRLVWHRTLSLFFSFLFAATVFGVEIVNWQFNGVTNFGLSPMTPTSKNEHITIIDGLTRGVGFKTNTTPGNNAWGGNDLMLGTAIAAVNNDDYAYFSITVNEGYLLSLTQIAPYNIRHSSTGPTAGQWQYQVGSGDFVNIGTEITWGSVTNATGNPQSAIDLSGISALQNVSAGIKITIRVAIWGGTGTTGTWYFNGNGSVPLILNGSICEIPSLSFPVSIINKVEGDVPFTQAATSNSSGTISYSSDNSSIASVNSATAEVTLGTTRGTATITATQEASGIYCAAAASYEIEYDCATVTLSGTSDICKNAGTTLTPNITGGVWQSEYPEVATVVDGLVTGKDSGMVKIMYTTPAGCPTDKYITIFPLPVTSEITHQ